MTRELIAIIEGREMGRVTRDKTGKLSFIYNEEWRNASDAFPLSISMPLALSEHGNAKIDPFIWGLLPDKNAVSHWSNEEGIHHFGVRKIRVYCAYFFISKETNRREMLVEDLVS